MTSAGLHPAPPRWQPRTGAELLCDQVTAIGAWTAQHRARAAAADPSADATRSREMRLDLTRRLDVLRRQHEALVARTEQHLATSDRVLQTAVSPRALLVHRSEWFVAKLSAALTAGGIDVVAQLDNGADAVGVAVAEQPDLLLVEDKLPMVSGEDVLREVLPYAPRTLAVAQASYEDEVPTLLAAGARTAVTRRVPPAEVAQELCRLVGVASTAGSAGAWT